jgi:hypothetical protein
MTYMAFRRSLALQDSRALRGWARAGLPVPRTTPGDTWGEWCNTLKTNGASFGRRAAA